MTTHPFSADISFCMRWFGDHDPVPLQHIAQVPGVRSVVSALVGVPTGKPWPKDDAARLRDTVERAALKLDVIESIAVSDEIKLQGPSADAHIDAWCESLRTVADLGVRVVCYNFMPIADWVRTELAHQLPDGSNTLGYDERSLPDLEERILAGHTKDLPAWDHVDHDAFVSLREHYAQRGESGLWDALGHFLERVVPVAESCDVRLGIHPDDPCWSVLGLPRIITSPAAFERVCGLVDSHANGVTFCTGSLGCDPDNDLVAGARALAKRTSFVHARNLSRTGDRAFHETSHPRHCGNIDLPAIMAALVDNGFKGPIRPDHGRNIWGESGTPGYGLYDRALGITYLQGILDTLELRDHPRA